MKKKYNNAFENVLLIAVLFFLTISVCWCMGSLSLRAANSDKPTQMETKLPIASYFIEGKIETQLDTNKIPKVDMAQVIKLLGPMAAARVVVPITHYSFSALVGTNGYSISLFDEEKAKVSEVWSNGEDTVVFSSEPSGTTGLSPHSKIYQAYLSATPFPFRAPEEIQSVWSCMCIDKKGLMNILTNDPPGIIYSNVFSNLGLNWYEFSLKNIKYDKNEKRILGFEQMSPGNFLEDKQTLIKNNLSQDFIDKAQRSPYCDQYILNDARNPEGFVRYKLETSGNFKDTDFPAEAKLIRFSTPNQEKKQTIDVEYLLSVDSVEKNIQKIDLPRLPSLESANNETNLVEISDYRFKGTKSSPRQYVVLEKNIWPLNNSEIFLREKSLAVGGVTSSKKGDFPYLIFTTIAFICILPMLIFLIKKKIKK